MGDKGATSAGPELAERIGLCERLARRSWRCGKEKDKAPRKPARAGEPEAAALWDRLQSQIYWYDRKAKSNRTAYKISKISIVALAILLPVFAE